MRIAAVVGDGAPVLRVLHAVDDRTVAARRLAEAAAVLARGQRAELAAMLLHRERVAAELAVECKRLEALY